jgi:aldehyde dehydrogenase
MIYPNPGSTESTVVFKTQYNNYIGGQWIAPVNGKYYTNKTPVTGGDICEVARSDEHDIELALDAAHQAKEAWGNTSVTERSNIL